MNWEALRAPNDPGIQLIAVQLTGLFFGLALGIVPALIANAVLGVGFSAPLDDQVGPASLRWILLALALAVAVTLYGALARRPVRWAFGEMAFPACEGALVFWLWLHGAYALLWPMAAFTLLYMFARAGLWSATEMVEAPQVAAMAPSAGPGASAAPAAAQALASEQFPALSAPRTFADVLGMQREKRALYDFAQEASAGRKNGALLSGPPGAGKSYLVTALAGEIGLPIITATAGQYFSKWVNETTENVRRAFEAARAQAPCVLFLDEIDSLMGERGAMGANDLEGPRTVNTLLTELTAIRECRVPVLVLAATNFPERLDQAGKREGRFDVKIEIGLPDEATRRALLAAGIGSQNAPRIRPGTLDRAARHFAGFSIARLQAIANLARKWVEAERDPEKMIGFNLLLQALRQVQGLNLAARYERVPGLDAIVLGPEARSELETLVKLMRDIESAELANKGLPVGAVFYGPPGTGKTLTAKALAKAANWAFVATTGHDLVTSEDAMDQLVSRAADERPAIVFIDEADDILGNRMLSPHVKMATNKLFTLVDGERGRIPDVFYIAATNHPEALDEAAVRRFAKKIEFALPGPREIERYVREWLARRPNVRLSAAWKARRAAELLAGRSVADLDAALQDAVNRADAPGLRPGDLVRAVKSLSFGSTP